MVESVYSKLGYVKRCFDSDEELLQILDASSQQTAIGRAMDVDNPDAVEELERYLALQDTKMLPTSMEDVQRRFSAIPYGWREIDIAAAVCALISTQKVTLQYSGNAIQPTDRHIPDCLRRKTEIKKSILTRRIAISDSLMKKSREFLKEYFNTMDVPTDEDSLIAFVQNRFSAQRDELQKLLTEQYGGKAYPDRAVVENGIQLCGELLSQKKDNTALLEKMTALEDEFLDFAEDLSDVQSFFRHHGECSYSI